MFLSFTDKIKAKLKQKLASRMRNKESIVWFLRVDTLRANKQLVFANDRMCNTVNKVIHCLYIAFCWSYLNNLSYVSNI